MRHWEPRTSLLKTFPGADHNFYDALGSRVTSKHNPSKRAQVTATVSEWITAH